MSEVHDQASNEVRVELPKVAREELRPIVREAITEDVMRSIHELVGLTPRVKDVLEQHLLGDDPKLAAQAAGLLLKYTVGHPALVQHEDTAAGNQINVNFELPRPDESKLAHAEIAEAEVVEEEDRTCDMCHTTKPASEFVVNSERCQECFANWSEAIKQKFLTG